MSNHIPSIRDIISPSPSIEIDNEPPARLIVDPPLPESLSQGKFAVLEVVRQ
jgi:hypothetical protein